MTRSQLNRRFLSLFVHAGWVALAMLLWATQPAHSQSVPADVSTAESPIPDPVGPPRGKPIPISEIGPESERTKGNLKEVLLSIQPDGTFESIIIGLPDVRANINIAIEHSDQIQSRVASVSELDRLARDWDPILTQLDRFESRLDRRVRQVDAAMSKIADKQARWAATRRALGTQQVSGEVILQIDDVDSAIKDSIEKANTQQAAGVRLQSDVASLQQIAEGDLSRIALARQAVVSRVFLPDSPPAWSSEIWRTLTGDQIGKNLENLKTQYIEAQSEFLGNYGEKSLFFVLLTLGLVLSMFPLRKRVNERLRSEEDVEALLGMFNRPISLGILLSFIAALGIFSGSLRTLEYILSAMAVVPAVLILRQILDRPFYPVLSITLAV